MWPELKLIHRKPRHSQSQGSIERAKIDVQNMMMIWVMKMDQLMGLKASSEKFSRQEKYRI